MYHIGLAVDDLGVHGAVRRIVELGNALTGAGHWATIYTKDGTPCTWLPQLAESSTHKALASASLDCLVYAAGVPEAYDSAMSATAKIKIAYVLAIPNIACLDNPTDPYTRRVVSMLTTPGWMTACCSTAMWKEIREHTGRPALLLLGGVNRSIFHRRRVKRTGNTITILSSGDHREREGSGDAKAAADLVAKHYPAVLWETYFKRGYSQSQMAEAYSAANVFLDAQRYAGWTNAVAEAMACGTPVVCTDIGGSADLAIHEETALVVKPRDVQAMADSVERVLGDADLRGRLVRNALARVERFTYSAMACRLEEIIRGNI